MSVEIGPDWSRVPDVELNLLGLLRKTRRPGGVAIKRSLGTIDPFEHNMRRVMERAARNLVLKHAPALRIVQHEDHEMLMRAPDVRASMSPDEEAYQERAGAIVTPARIEEVEALFAFEGDRNE